MSFSFSIQGSLQHLCTEAKALPPAAINKLKHQTRGSKVYQSHNVPQLSLFLNLSFNSNDF